jgi:hypothetical protein
VFDTPVKKLKYIGFPCRDIFIQHAVTVIRCQADCRVYLQQIRFMQAFEFRGQVAAGGCTVVVLSMSEHDGSFVLRMAVSNRSRNSADRSQLFVAPAKVTAACRQRQQQDAGEAVSHGFFIERASTRILRSCQIYAT